MDPLDPWHYRFFRRHIKVVAKCPYCRRELTEADMEDGRCPSCKEPLKDKRRLNKSIRSEKS
ncbi:MAG: hypothetical protein N3E47_02565 [Candidatus Bathyarchaeota archaeon]|nr:hypothetical protein [Candidatus Bathyarchaeota archaeon]